MLTGDRQGGMVVTSTSRLRTTQRKAEQQKGSIMSQGKKIAILALSDKGANFRKGMETSESLRGKTPKSLLRVV